MQSYETAHIRSARKEQIKNLTVLCFSLDERFYIIMHLSSMNIFVSVSSCCLCWAAGESLWTNLTGVIEMKIGAKEICFDHILISHLLSHALAGKPFWHQCVHAMDARTHTALNSIFWCSITVKQSVSLWPTQTKFLRSYWCIEHASHFVWSTHTYIKLQATHLAYYVFMKHMWMELIIFQF